MGCKQSKYSSGPDMLDVDQYQGDDTGMYDTEIIPSHRYGEFAVNGSGSLNAQASLTPVAPPSSNNHVMCSDAHFTKMAEGCTAGFLDMFSLSNNKMITNGPAMDNAYQQPAYNYQQPESDRSLHSQSNSARSGHSGHSQGSHQRRSKVVRDGSFAL